MSYIVNKDGAAIRRFLAGPLRLAELLTDEEYRQFQTAEIVALTLGGALLSLSSLLQDGDEVTLRPPRPENDLHVFSPPQ